MSSKNKPVLTVELTTQERRELVLAARDLVRLHLTTAMAAAGVATQNYQGWCKGVDTRLGVERQKSVLSLFGLTPSGQLTDCNTHTWRIAGAENTHHAEFLLLREAGMKDVRINFAYAAITTSSDQIGLVGAAVKWLGPYILNASIKERERHLILTAVAGTWLAEDFREWVLKLFRSTSISPKEVEIGPDLRISNSSANTIWRWHAAPRKTDGSRFTGGKRKSLLPFDQDLVGEHEADETPMEILQDITPRFIELAEKTAADRKSVV